MNNKFFIKLNGVEEIKAFVRIAQLYDCTILACNKSIDCSSIIGMFTLDVKRPIEIEIFTDDKKVIQSFCDDIEQFIVRE